jgi:uncharacterized RDD family membrane protein YckC
MKAELFVRNRISLGGWMYCVYCGADNPNCARFCRSCGQPVENIAPLPSDELKAMAAAAPQGTGVPADASAPEMHSVAPVAMPETTNQQNSVTPVSGMTGSAVAPVSLGPTHQVRETGQDSTTNASAAFTPVTYGTLSERLGAYIADLIVIYLIVFGVYFVSGLLGVFGKGFLSGAESEAKAIFFVALFIYMTTSLTVCHTTIGKYIAGLEVASESPKRAYPSFWKVLLRETIGRIFSSCFFGVGYWRVPRNPNRQAWSDEISGTVVRHRSVNSSLKWALTSFVVIGLILDVGLIAYGTQAEEREKNHAAWEQEISSISAEVQTARTTANQIISRDPKNLEDWQENMRQLLPALDVYDRKLDQFHRSLQRGDQENLFASDDERHQTLVLEQVTDLRKQQNAKLREEADLVTSYDPRMSDYGDFQSKLRLLDSDVSGLDHKASEMLAGIGIK